MIDRMHVLCRADNQQREAVDLFEAVRIEELREGVVRIHFRNGDKEIYAAKLYDLLSLYSANYDSRSGVSPIKDGTSPKNNGEEWIDPEFTADADD